MKKTLFSFTHATRLFVAVLLVTAITGCRNAAEKNGQSQEPTVTGAPATDSAHYQVVEILAKDTAFAGLVAFLQERNIAAGSIYHWQNHLVVYGRQLEGRRLAAAIKSSYPEDTVNYYDNPFYTFERKYCADTAVTTEWDNILLTASLVADTALQQEYMNYHATQFTEWPEVAKGFCNARFQQLLVFRNGRQLMLVISIPKGESLDKLNPKTEENNPRVKEWNKIMAKYQEGIAGTKPGETWVFLQPVR